ncbi:hypothetical protein CDAR_254621 [Caerostris darwini]|uniref:Uncharacterized protein n=1 Tax=Caerostris darwini TaxID=1538125 RepID=A0AAV4N9I8_9ARAC|nr:hypothetical protein CDAR_254621 [Caerostris darwini]
MHLSGNYQHKRFNNSSFGNRLFSHSRIISKSSSIIFLKRNTWNSVPSHACGPFLDISGPLGKQQMTLIKEFCYLGEDTHASLPLANQILGLGIISK